jgi:hypothetical protein
MRIKFFLFRESDGLMFALLPDMPSNVDFDETGDIIFRVHVYVRGVNWDKVYFWFNETGIMLDQKDYKYKYYAAIDQIGMNNTPYHGENE